MECEVPERSRLRDHQSWLFNLALFSPALLFFSYSFVFEKIARHWEV